MTSEKDMQAFAEKWAAGFKGGEVVELVGDVGAGKTTFVKGLARGLGVNEVVQSPSFTLFSRYNGSRGRSLHHYDFYRLDDPGVVAYDLAESITENKAVTVVEWGQTVSHVLPASRTTVHITTLGETDRQLEIKGNT